LSRQSLLTGLLATVIVVALGAWLATHFEVTSRKVYQGFVGEARRNPYLAAEYFLRRMGLDARTLESPRELNRLPSPEATIIIPTERFTLGKERAEALLDWARQGGHLIVRVRRPIRWNTDPEDPLLDLLKIGGTDLGWDDVEAQTTTVIDREDRDDLMEVDFYEPYVLDTDIADPLWQVDDPYGTRLIQVALGHGRLTVLSNIDFWSNDSIDDYSHARLLYILAATQGGGEVLILRSDDLPPIWQWVWDRMPALVIATVLLLLAWLARATRRFGPLLPAAAPPRRKLLEHVEASGHYLWRTGCRSELVEASREALLRRLRLAQPHLAGLRPKELSVRLADLTGLGARAIEQALIGPDTSGREQVMRRIQILEILRKRL